MLKKFIGDFLDHVEKIAETRGERNEYIEEPVLHFLALSRDVS
jgi:hypothetical protein